MPWKTRRGAFCYVADGEEHAAAGQREDVVEVAADLRVARGRPVRHRDRRVGDGRHLGQQGVLQALGDAAGAGFSPLGVPQPRREVQGHAGVIREHADARELRLATWAAVEEPLDRPVRASDLELDTGGVDEAVEGLPRHPLDIRDDSELSLAGRPTAKVLNPGNVHAVALTRFGSDYWVVRSDPSLGSANRDLVIRIMPEGACPSRLTASAIGIMMRAVDVFDIPIDRIAVAIMKANSSLPPPPDEPSPSSRARARRRCSPVRSTASARNWTKRW